MNSRPQKDAESGHRTHQTPPVISHAPTPRARQGPRGPLTLCTPGSDWADRGPESLDVSGASEGGRRRHPEGAGAGTSDTARPREAVDKKEDVR